MNIKETPLVSIIVPCYNSEKYLPAMMNCLLRQTYHNFEAIFVDDGSMDQTTDIIESYQEDTRIHLIKQANQYAGVARNNGLKIAKGSYALFLDSDDLFADTLIEKLLESALKHDADVAICNINYIDEQTGEGLNRDVCIKKSILKKFEEKGTFSYLDIPNEILTIGFSGPYNKLCKVDFLQKKGICFQNSKRDNDLSFSLSVMAAADKISWVYDALYTYRVNNPKSLQGFCEKKIDVGDLVSTVQRTKDELQRLGRYEAVQYSFRRQVLNRWHYLLEQQCCFSNYKTVYDTLKHTILKILNIDIKDEYGFLTHRKDYKKIVELDAEEFLFWKYTKEKMYGDVNYIFPYESMPNTAKNVVIYGYGNIGQLYAKQIEVNCNYRLVAILDKMYESKHELDERVMNPDKIELLLYDVVVIAIEDICVAKAVIDWLVEKGVKRDTIIWDV